MVDTTVGASSKWKWQEFYIPRSIVQDNPTLNTQMKLQAFEQLRVWDIL